MKLKSSNKESFKFLGALIVLTIFLLALNGFTNKKKDKYANTPDFEQTTPLDFIQLTFNESQYNKLKKKRDKAISIGILQTDDSDYVPATIAYNGEDYRAEVRLKGDWTDHLKGDKWSFRIKLKNDQTILGMRKFSLHHPKTRGYVNEWFYHNAVKREELMGLRYSFVEGSIHIKLNNSPDYINKPVGIYAIEETFDKRTIESNKRKESVILKFSEDYWWAEVKKSIDVGKASGLGFYTFMNGMDFPVRSFSESKTLQDSVMRNYFEFSKELLIKSRDGTMTISKSFDVKKLALQNALMNLFGATHGNAIINLRFYYNPITSKLEPIAFDGNSGKRLSQYEHFNFIKDNKEEDTLYLNYLAHALNKVSNPDYLNKLAAENKDEMTYFGKILKPEFKTEGLSLKNLRYNQSIIKEELKRLKSEFKFDDVEIKENALKEFSIPELSAWRKNQVIFEKANSTFKGKKVYRLSRNNISKSGFTDVNNININYGNKYETSIIVKKGIDDFFGLRIQEAYPDRIDAVFDLNSGIVKGVKNANGGSFEQEKAEITSLGNGWYKCAVFGKINASRLRIIFGSTNYSTNNILSWEAATKEPSSVFISPKSLMVKELK